MPRTLGTPSSKGTPRTRAADRAGPGLRPGGRGGGEDRRHQLLPRVRVRPAGRERADPRGDLPRSDRGTRPRARSSASWSSRRPWCTSPPPCSRPPRERSSPARRRSPRTASRSSRRSTSRRAPGSSTACPYTILRPFNCVGIGERRALGDSDVMSGNVKLALSHVVPDLVLKVLKGQDPLHILGDGAQVRHYTYGGDLAHGIRLAMESPAGHQQRLQPLDGPQHHRAGARAKPSGARSAEPRRSGTSLTRRSTTTSSCACRMSARRARSWASRPPRPWTRCSTRSSPGSTSRCRPDASDGVPESCRPWMMDDQRRSVASVSSVSVISAVAMVVVLASMDVGEARPTHRTCRRADPRCLSSWPVTRPARHARDPLAGAAAASGGRTPCAPSRRGIPHCSSGYLGNAVLPLRLGEPIRAALVARASASTSCSASARRSRSASSTPRPSPWSPSWRP